jgi:hypothetical protein
VLNVHGVHDVRQMDIHTAEPLVPERSLVEVEIAIGKLRSYKSPGTDQFPTEFIKAEGETSYSYIHRGRYVDLKGRKTDRGEKYIIMSFTACILRRYC